MATRKQITFDLDTNALKIYYPSDNWRNAYEVIKNHMRKNNFSWVQGSVYVSNKPISSFEVDVIMRNAVKKYPWLNKCMRDCKQTNVGKQYNLNHIFDKDADVPTRVQKQSQIPPALQKALEQNPNLGTPLDLINDKGIGIGD